MMIFTSIYGVVDGFFISNYAGKTEFAAVNFIMPFIMILGILGFMLGAGGSALIGKNLGEGKKEKANEIFSMLVIVTIFSGIAIAVIAYFLMEPVASLLGAGDSMLDGCVLYGHWVLIGLPFVMLQYEFQSFYVVAEKPQMGLYTTLAAGVANIILDFLLVGVFRLGIPGAAIATDLSQMIGGIIPIVYFAGKNDSLLKIGKFKFDIKAFLQVCGNGSSEFVSNISMSVVGMLYNTQLLNYIGEDGVAAYGVLMYVNMIFISIFIGYSVGTAPIISYHFGAENTNELKSLFKKSLKIIASFAVLMLLAGELLARPLASIFVGYDDTLMDITLEAFRIFSFSFLFASVPIFGSSFFTALNDGLVSAIISFLRTIVFQIAAVIFLPMLFGADGIWYSIVAAEIVAALVTIFFWVTKRKKYNY